MISLKSKNLCHRFPNGSQMVFILGCERSGSTWLSNVLDIHTDIEFYMEPFADYAEIFPGFPHRNLPIQSKDETLAKLLLAKFEHLPRLKYPLLYRPGKRPEWKIIDRYLAGAYSWLGTALRYSASRRLNQFRLLGLNLNEVSVRLQSKKSVPAKLVATKELRLNFKIGLLTATFDDVKFIVIIRHPGAQIASIRRLISNNHLGELKKSLSSFPAYLHNVERFQKYRRCLDLIENLENLDELLALWWLVNYDVLLEDCRANDCDFLVVSHENISENSISEFSRIFDFLEMNPTRKVSDYILSSSQRTAIKSSPVATDRDSKSYYKAAISASDPVLLDILTRLATVVEIAPVLRRYLDISTTLSGCRYKIS